ncbi:MAG: hypothetical protein ISR65_15740 [Bacteriovoracaceae bacterium]|nr:hypothetical protein [Bacteriovoracaceae bacterium]
MTHILSKIHVLIICLSLILPASSKEKDSKPLGEQTRIKNTSALGIALTVARIHPKCQRIKDIKNAAWASQIYLRLEDTSWDHRGRATSVLQGQMCAAQDKIGVATEAQKRQLQNVENSVDATSGALSNLAKQYAMASIAALEYAEKRAGLISGGTCKKGTQGCDFLKMGLEQRVKKHQKIADKLPECSFKKSKINPKVSNKNLDWALKLVTKLEEKLINDVTKKDPTKAIESEIESLGEIGAADASDSSGAAKGSSGAKKEGSTGKSQGASGGDGAINEEQSQQDGGEKKKKKTTKQMYDYYMKKLYGGNAKAKPSNRKIRNWDKIVKSHKKVLSKGYKDSSSCKALVKKYKKTFKDIEKSLQYISQFNHQSLAPTGKLSQKAQKRKKTKTQQAQEAVSNSKWIPDSVKEAIGSGPMGMTAEEEQQVNVAQNKATAVIDALLVHPIGRQAMWSAFAKQSKGTQGVDQQKSKHIDKMQSDIDEILANQDTKDTDAMLSDFEKKSATSDQTGGGRSQSDQVGANASGVSAHEMKAREWKRMQQLCDERIKTAQTFMDKRFPAVDKGSYPMPTQAEVKQFEQLQQYIADNKAMEEATTHNWAVCARGAGNSAAYGSPAVAEACKIRDKHGAGSAGRAAFENHLKDRVRDQHRMIAQDPKLGNMLRRADTYAHKGSNLLNNDRQTHRNLGLYSHNQAREELQAEIAECQGVKNTTDPAKIDGYLDDTSLISKLDPTRLRPGDDPDDPVLAAANCYMSGRVGADKKLTGAIKTGGQLLLAGAAVAMTGPVGIAAVGSTGAAMTGYEIWEKNKECNQNRVSGYMTSTMEQAMASSVTGDKCQEELDSSIKWAAAGTAADVVGAGMAMKAAKVSKLASSADDIAGALVDGKRAGKLAKRADDLPPPTSSLVEPGNEKLFKTCTSKFTRKSGCKGFMETLSHRCTDPTIASANKAHCVTIESSSEFHRTMKLSDIIPEEKRGKSVVVEFSHDRGHLTTRYYKDGKPYQYDGGSFHSIRKLKETDQVRAGSHYVIDVTPKQLEEIDRVAKLGGASKACTHDARLALSAGDVVSMPKGATGLYKKFSVKELAKELTQTYGPPNHNTVRAMQGLVDAQKGGFSSAQWDAFGVTEGAWGVLSLGSYGVLYPTGVVLEATTVILLVDPDGESISMTMEAFERLQGEMK